MIPRAFKVLLPCPTATVEQPATEGVPASPSVATSEHARLSANTAELWFALVARLGS